MSDTVYLVKIHKDIYNNYEGLDDTRIYLFSEQEKAEAKLKKEYDEWYKELKEDDDELEVEFESNSFSITNQVDYVHGRIEETHIDLD